MCRIGDSDGDGRHLALIGCIVCSSNPDAAATDERKGKGKKRSRLKSGKKEGGRGEGGEEEKG